MLEKCELDPVYLIELWKKYLSQTKPNLNSFIGYGITFEYKDIILKDDESEELKINKNKKVKKKKEDKNNDNKNDNNNLINYNHIICILFIYLRYIRYPISYYEIISYINENKLLYYNSFEYLPKELKSECEIYKSFFIPKTHLTDV